MTFPETDEYGSVEPDVAADYVLELHTVLWNLAAQVGPTADTHRLIEFCYVLSQLKICTFLAFPEVHYPAIYHDIDDVQMLMKAELESRSVWVPYIVKMNIPRPEVMPW